MSRINTGRLVLGAFAAGVVINIVESVMNLTVLAATMEEMLASLNRPPLAGAAMGGYVVLAFALGFLLVWTYAAIRPRYGAGPGTALRAGAAVWGGFYAFGVGANWLLGIVSLRLYLLTLAYTFPMTLAAAYVGGMVYREE